MQTGIRSDIFTLFAAIFLGLILSFSADSLRAQETVRIGVGVDPVLRPWWIAEEKGFYQKHGIKAEITQFSGGPALATRPWQARRTSAPRERRHGCRGSCGAQWSCSERWPPQPRPPKHGGALQHQVAGRPERQKGRHRRRKLDGLSVGHGGEEVERSRIGVRSDLHTPPELIPSLDRGEIQAYFVWEPWASRAVEMSGKSKVHIMANSGDVGYLLNFVVVANKKFVDAKPEATVRVLAALRDAINFQNSNPAEAVRIGAEKNKLKPELASFIIGLYRFSLGSRLRRKRRPRQKRHGCAARNGSRASRSTGARPSICSYLKRAMTMP